MRAPVPFPPRHIGLEYTPDPDSKIELASQYSQFSPEIPFTMALPNQGVCEKKKLLVVSTPASHYNEQSGGSLQLLMIVLVRLVCCRPR